MRNPAGTWGRGPPTPYRKEKGLFHLRIPGPSPLQSPSGQTVHCLHSYIPEGSLNGGKGSPCPRLCLGTLPHLC